MWPYGNLRNNFHLANTTNHGRSEGGTYKHLSRWRTVTICKISQNLLASLFLSIFHPQNLRTPSVHFPGTRNCKSYRCNLHGSIIYGYISTGTHISTCLHGSYIISFKDFSDSLFLKIVNPFCSFDVIGFLRLFYKTHKTTATMKGPERKNGAAVQRKYLRRSKEGKVRDEKGSGWEGLGMTEGKRLRGWMNTLFWVVVAAAQVWLISTYLLSRI